MPRINTIHILYYFMIMAAFTIVVCIVLAIGRFIWKLNYPGPPYTDLALKSITDPTQTVVAYDLNSKRDQVLYMTVNSTIGIQTARFYYWDSRTKQNVYLTSIENVSFQAGSEPERLYNEVNRSIIPATDNTFMILRGDEVLYIDSTRSVQRFRLIYDSMPHEAIEAIAQQFLQQNNLSQLTSINGRLFLPIGDQTVVYCCLDKNHMPSGLQSIPDDLSLKAILPITKSIPITETAFFNTQYREHDHFWLEAPGVTIQRQLYACDFMYCRYDKYNAQTTRGFYTFSVAPYIPFSHFFTLATGELVWFENGQLYILP